MIGRKSYLYQLRRKRATYKTGNEAGEQNKRSEQAGRVKDGHGWMVKEKS